MEERFLIDTNILIYFLSNQIPESHLKFIKKILTESFNISTITKIELLGWQKIDAKSKAKIENFLKNSDVYYIDKIIETKAIELKQEYKIAIPDALIVSTALVNEFTLVSRNEKDFKKINKIKIYNPFQ